MAPPSYPNSRPLPIVHINAFPGTGKLTVAQKLTRLAPSGVLRLVHNHLLINPADAVLRRDEAGYQSLRHRLRSVVFSSLIDEPATRTAAYIFTDFQTSNNLGSAVCQEYENCARKRGSLFIPITFVCDEDVNLQRLCEGDRSSHGKLTDAVLLSTFRSGAVLYEFDMNPLHLRLDVSHLSADDAALQLLQHLQQVCPELGHYLGNGKGDDSMN
ncbi:hypothetical protein LZ31DRAFT_561012 [Colletotrichum somersetense]|nr:hypothetical protein LZ31DRAFT_561012 [Colletotrichum somersetense]